MSTRLVMLARPLRPLLRAPSRLMHSTHLLGAAAKAPQPPINSKYPSPYDVPLTEQAKEVAGDVGKKLGEVAGQTIRLGKKAVEKVKRVTGGITHPGNHTRSLHSASATAAAVSSVKQAAGDAWNKTKQAAREVKDAAGLGNPSGAPSSSSTRDSTRREGYSQGRGGEVASSTFKPSDRQSASEPIRQAVRSEQLSTSTGRSQSFTVGGGADNDKHANTSATSVGENMHSVKKSMFDGPQEMPQGVGERAHDAKGEAMETGTKGS